MTISVTHHATARAKQRLGVREVMTLAMRASDKGREWADILNPHLRRYLMKNQIWGDAKRGPSRMVIYEGAVFVFDPKSGTLITCWRLPNELRGLA